VVRASDLRLSGREFDPRPPHYWSVGDGMGDRLHWRIPPRYVTGHQPTQPPTLCATGNEYRTTTGHAALMRCGCGSKEGWLISFRGWQVKLCDPSRHAELFGGEYTHEKARAIQMSYLSFSAP